MSAADGMLPIGLLRAIQIHNRNMIRLHDLTILQKRAIRIIGNVGYRDHTSKLFKSFKCLKLVYIIKLQTCVLMYNANKGILPRNVQLNFIKNRDVHKYNTRRRKVKVVLIFGKYQLTKKV